MINIGTAFLIRCYVRTMNGHSLLKNKQSLTILCAIDFSESSRHALTWTIGMAEPLQAHVVILYTFRLLQSKSGEALATKRKMEELVAHDFSLIEKELLHNHPVSYEFRTEVGFVSDRIEDFLKKNNIHLIVVGKTRGDDNRETLNGLIEGIKIPIMIVP